MPNPKRAVREPRRTVRADPGATLVVPRDARRIRVRPRHLPLLRRLPGSSRPRGRPGTVGELPPRRAGRDDAVARRPAGPGTGVQYWRDGRYEVDFVVSSGSAILGIEVRSGRNVGTFAGLGRFAREYPRARTLIVGTGGLDLAEFLSAPTEFWLR